MNLRTYRAYSLQQALDAVREDMGPGAVVLRTTTVRRGGILGLGARTLVEVTASDTPPRAPVRLPEPGTSAGGRVERAAGGDAATGAPAGGHAGRARRLLAVARRAQQEREARGGPDAELGAGAAPVEIEAPEARTGEASPTARTRHRGRLMPDVHPPIVVSRSPDEAEEPRERVGPDEPANVAVDAAEAASPSDGGAGAATPDEPVSEPVAGTVVEPVAAPARPEPAAGPTIAAPADEIEAAPKSVPPGTQRPTGFAGEAPCIIDEQAAIAARPARAPSGSDRPRPGLDEELEAIRGLVSDVLQQPRAAVRGAMPRLLFEQYLRLVGQEMPPERADAVVEAVRLELTPEELERPETVSAAVLDRVADLVPVAAEPLPARSPDGRPLTIALVGPTGVGKTTTLAKLAASFTLRHGRRVALVTADTYRVAAVEQLRTYAEILDVPLAVVDRPGAMRDAVRAAADRDVVLVDTAGRGQRDAARLEELRAFMAAANPHETHLVLSSTASERVLRREAEAFGGVGVDKLILTKLDEAAGFGLLVDAVHRIGLDLSFVTTGQEVPDDLERGCGRRLAALALGAPIGGAA